MHGHGKQEREMQFLRHANIGASLQTCYSVCSMSNYHPPQHNDPFGQTHNSIFCATNRHKDMPPTASSNTNMKVPRMNNYSSGTSGFGYYSEQARFSAPGVPVSAHGRKRAVLCGVSYYSQRCRLNGTVNDVKCMRNFLIQRLAFPSDSILILTGRRVSE
ncbi:hypothetical protein BUALT_Bualt15G0068900 [Buddleja alternifolia]|uniref:Uncharacterized protein n=1 Tax=Buddleja alternifolia TaxID=168488 RepID=A0AAV6WDU3_9LAMI|nr:hypothetical protein BUALT_Bualt15G0068900 [Buddleja alternifolia]